MSGILTVFLYRSCKLFLLCIVIYIFGGGTTDVSIVSKGGINYASTIKIGGNDFDEGKLKSLKQQKSLSNMFDEYLKFKSNTKKLEIEKVSRKAEMG